MTGTASFGNHVSDSTFVRFGTVASGNAPTYDAGTRDLKSRPDMAGSNDG